ncbi:hypothetical protein L9G15_00745 [Shewanella sp. A3A]|nr:hypothetical protein [Shewanella ferrihydritica]
MRSSIEKQPLLKAKTLTILLKLADLKGDVDFKSESISQLWAINELTEDHLFELNESGAISFDMIGEDGFAPIIICTVGKETYDHLTNCLAQITNDTNILDQRVVSLLNHNPKKLQDQIKQSQRHIAEAKLQIRSNELLKPLEKPLSNIEQHFSSISRVAENYDDVYMNIVKPVQDEGKSGVRATVIWAIISIIASWVLTNFSQLKSLTENLFS